jgi:hypothetical protein
MGKTGKPLVSVIIPTFNRRKKLKGLLDSLVVAYSAYPYFEIIVVDDCSNDGTRKMMKKEAEEKDFIRFISLNKNQRVAAARNRGIAVAEGDYLFFIDDDVIIEKQTIPKLLEFIEAYKDKVIVGPLICELENPKRIWFAGLRINLWTTGGKFLYQGRTIAEISEKTKIPSDGLITSFLIPRKVVEEIGGFNEKLFPFGFEEIDFCFRARQAGYQLVVITKAIVYHDRHKGAGMRNYWKLYLASRNRFIAYWLWSKNIFQQFTIFFFSLFYAFFYLFLFFVQNPKSDKKRAILTTFKGVKDGIGLMIRSYPYRFCSKDKLRFFCLW